MDETDPQMRMTTAFGIVLSLGLIMAVGYGIDLANRGARAWTRAGGSAKLAVSGWPDQPKSAARLIIDRHGPPDWTGTDRLVWLRRDPWKRVTVSRYPAYSPLEQAVDYRVSKAMLPAVSSFNHGVRADPGLGELLARSDRESLNCLALNLAWEVAEGYRTLDSARDFYGRTASLAAAGKSSPYLEGLLFTPEGVKPPRKWELPSDVSFRGLGAP